MSKVVVLGAGIAGHTAAAHLRRKLSKEHQVVVVSPNRNYQWVPSNIWVGIGRMKAEEIYFPLRTPVQKERHWIHSSQSRFFSSRRRCIGEQAFRFGGTSLWRKCGNTRESDL